MKQNPEMKSIFSSCIWLYRMTRNQFGADRVETRIRGNQGWENVCCFLAFGMSKSRVRPSPYFLLPRHLKFKESPRSAEGMMNRNI